MTQAISHWSQTNQDHAHKILESYPQKRSAIMPLLYVASLEHEFASVDAMTEVAELTGVTAAQVQSVATFYTMFRRQKTGSYLVSVCTGISCYLMGADDVLEAVEQASEAPHGAVSRDGLFSVEHVECVGACGGAPAVQVNYELVEGLTGSTCQKLIEWLRETRPSVVLADEMQQLFGGQRSFDWGPPEHEGAIGPVPAFGPYGSVGTDT